MERIWQVDGYKLLWNFFFFFFYTICQTDICCHFNSFFKYIYSKDQLQTFSEEVNILSVSYSTKISYSFTITLVHLYGQ